MKKLALLFALASAPALAGETPPQALKALPAFPSAATSTMDCSVGENTQRKVTEVTSKMQAMAASPAASTVTSMTPEQMTAMQQLTDPAFTMCPIEAMQPESLGWQQAPEEKLKKSLADINAAMQKAYTAWCEKQKTNVCLPPQPELLKPFTAQAAAAGTQYLKEMQPGYAKYFKQVGACLALREKPVAAARGVSGAFGVMAAGAEGQDWGLVGMVADAHSHACSKAREAANTYIYRQ